MSPANGDTIVTVSLAITRWQLLAGSCPSLPAATGHKADSGLRRLSEARRSLENLALFSPMLATRLFVVEVVPSGARPSSATPEQWTAWKERR